jgi:hypothetical protein
MPPVLLRYLPLGAQAWVGGAGSTSTDDVEPEATSTSLLCSAASGRSGRVQRVTCSQAGVTGFFCAARDTALEAADAAYLSGARQHDLDIASRRAHGGVRLSGVPLGATEAALDSAPPPGDASFAWMTD